MWVEKSRGYAGHYDKTRIAKKHKKHVLIFPVECIVHIRRTCFANDDILINTVTFLWKEAPYNDIKLEDPNVTVNCHGHVSNTEI